MTRLILAIAAISLGAAGGFLLIRRLVVWTYRGLFFIGLSLLYFLLIFLAAKMFQGGIG